MCVILNVKVVYLAIESKKQNSKFLQSIENYVVLKMCKSKNRFCWGVIFFYYFHLVYLFTYTYTFNIKKYFIYFFGAKEK